MLEFSGKKILIIGASSGIGEETARVLAAAGAFVILVARREDRLKKIIDEIPSDQKVYYTGDVSKTEDIEGLISRIINDNGPLDGMVYTAGTTIGDVPLKYLSMEKHMDTFMVNYFGFIECVRQVTKRRAYNRGMRIVAVSSMASLRGDKAHLAYCASKAAMDSAIRCIAMEYGKKGICINSVAPSMIRTDMYQKYLDNRGEENNTDAGISDRQYLGLGEKRDVANAITFLLSEEARFITGITMPVDGGVSST